MSVSITAIQAADSIAGSRLTLNSNFASIATEINNIEYLINPSTAAISGILSLSVSNSGVNYATSVLNVGQAATILGNLFIGATSNPTSVSILGSGNVTLSQASLVMSNGSVIVGSTSSASSFSGNVTISGELCLPGSANAFSNMISLTAASASINVSGLKYLVVSNSSGSAGLTASLSSADAGQVLEIFHVKGPSGYPVIINATNFNGLTGGIILTESGDTLKCLYDGTKWYLWSYSAMSFAGGPKTFLKFITGLTAHGGSEAYNTVNNGYDGYSNVSGDGTNEGDVVAFSGQQLANSTQGKANTGLIATIYVTCNSGGDDATGYISGITIDNGGFYLSDQWSITDVFTWPYAESESGPSTGSGPGQTTFTITTTGTSPIPVGNPVGSSILLTTTN